MKKIYKETFDNIYLDKKMDNIILNKTIYKSPKYISKKLIVTMSIFLVFLIVGISVGIVYADEIVEKLKNVFITTKIDFDENKGVPDLYLSELKIENIKDLNVDAEFPNIKFPVLDNQQKIEFEELKNGLKINILTPQIIKNETLRIIQFEKNNDKISQGQFVLDDVYKSKKGHIYMAIEFITKYYEKDYFMITLGHTRGEDNAYKSLEFNENLNTKVYFYARPQFSNDDEKLGNLTATFVYDDICYTFQGTNISKNEMVNLLNDLEYYN